MITRMTCYCKRAFAFGNRALHISCEKHGSPAALAANYQTGKRTNPYKAFTQELFYYTRHISSQGILATNTSVLVFKARQLMILARELIIVNSISVFRLCKLRTSLWTKQSSVHKADK